MNISFIYLILIQWCALFKTFTNRLFELQMPFSELAMLESCVIHHFNGNCVQIQNVLISPIFQYATTDSFCQIMSHMRIVGWIRWNCPSDTGFEIRALAVWGRSRYLSVTQAPTILDLYERTRKTFLFLWILERGTSPRSPTFQTDFILTTAPGPLPSRKIFVSI